MRLFVVIMVAGLMAMQAVPAQAKSKKAKASAKAAEPAQRAEEVESAFQEFCTEWMHKLEVREENNVAHIQWSTKADQVEGEYVGYTHDHTCTLAEHTKVPVGKITYQQTRYQKSGPSVTEAQQSAPHAVETTGVTEIFRYDHGKWIY